MNLTLKNGIYLEPTPAGAYYAVSSTHDEPARRILIGIMSDSSLPLSDISRITHWSGESKADTMALVKRLQEMSLLSGTRNQLAVPDGSLEVVLPSILAKVSIEKKALLADDQGFYLSTSNFPHEAAEALSAVSADLGSLYDRHRLLLKNNLSIDVQAWALSDAAGNSQLGFWPIYIGKQRFVLIIQGRPTLNQPSFRDLIWVLLLRYSETFNIRDKSDNG
ncbi:MAG: hypothetical protein P8163_03125 [Candidatus Thiodiazotropha sp.]